MRRSRNEILNLQIPTEITTHVDLLLLTPRHQELYRRLDEILHYVWDPIRITDVPEARDEYWSYLPKVFSLVIDGVDEETIANHLTMIEIHHMGGPPYRPREPRVGTVKAAQYMVHWRTALWPVELGAR